MISVADIADIAYMGRIAISGGGGRISDMEGTAKAQPIPVPLSSKDQRDVQELYDAIRKGKAKLVGPDGEVRLMPVSLYSFLVELIGLLNEGKCVYIVQNEAKLTTVEAATMLGVSRQFLVNLLQGGEISYHMVGTHRRIYAHDLLRYKAKRDGQRRKALDELVEAEIEQGLYDRVPPLNED
jgi:excisionase family DNA binding protein